jgi:predicted ferric reductase
MYKIHHKFGVFSFLFLLAHPLFLALKYLILISAESAAMFLLPDSDWPKNLGIISLLLMIVLIVVTMFSAFRYQALRLFHQVLGFAMFIGALHALLIPSDISRSTPLKIYMLTLAGSAIAAYLYRTVFGKIFVKKFSYSVVAVNKIKDDVTEIVMQALIKKMQYIPGQFIFISFEYGNISSEVHPFSITSAPHEDNLRITIKSLGDYTSAVSSLKVGAIAKIEGPFGKFSYLNSHSKDQVWVAGGIGVTPFLNMMRNIKHSPSNKYSIHMYYCTKTEQELVFLDEFVEASRSIEGFKLIPYCSEQKGFLTAKNIEELSGNVQEKDFFICGPPVMMNSLKEQLLKLGIQKYKLHLEEFKLL